jgi:hypothetical protein
MNVKKNYTEKKSEQIMFGIYNFIIFAAEL